MRMLVMFDLPTVTSEDMANYRRFRKSLMGMGFIMMQKSVYCKLIVTPGMENAAAEAIRKIRPPAGLVQLLTITEKQFGRMEYISGEGQKETIDSTERVIFL